MAYDHPEHRQYNLRGRTVDSYQVQPSHLDTGTGTTQGTRNFVNGVDTPAPIWDSEWSVGRQGGSGSFQNTAPGPGQRWQAGHLLARQNGGFGHLNEGVSSQNGPINMGHQQREQWRGQEQAFHDQVQDQDRSGHWTVTRRQQPRQRYDQFF